MTLIRRRSRTALVAAMIAGALALTACGFERRRQLRRCHREGADQDLVLQQRAGDRLGQAGCRGLEHRESRPRQVTAEEIPAGKSSEDVIGAAITAGTEPCLIYNTSPAAVPGFQKQGGLIDLSSFADGTSYIETRSGDAAKQYASPDGHYYQLPWKSNPVMIFYNKDSDDQGRASIRRTRRWPPTTSSWPPPRRSSTPRPPRTPSTRRRAASSTSPGSTSTRCSPPRAAGKQLVADGKSQFNSPEGLAVADFWKQIYADKLAGNETYTGDSFADGTAAMAIVGPWAISVYKDKVDWGVVPVPDRRRHGRRSDPHLLRRQERRHVRLLHQPGHRMGLPEVQHLPGAGRSTADPDRADAAAHRPADHLRGILRREPVTTSCSPTRPPAPSRSRTSRTRSRSGRPSAMPGPPSVIFGKTDVQQAMTDAATKIDLWPPSHDHHPPPDRSVPGEQPAYAGARVMRGGRRRSIGWDCGRRTVRAATDRHAAGGALRGVHRGDLRLPDRLRDLHVLPPTTTSPPQALWSRTRSSVSTTT